MQFLDPKIDVVFKKLFGSEDHKQITISFLNTMLEYTGDRVIEEIDFNNNEQGPTNPDKKENILDIFCTDKKGRKFIVEMQNRWMEAFDKRMMYYGSKAFSNQLHKGQPYATLNPVTVLAITKKFNVFSDEYDVESDELAHKSILVHTDLRRPNRRQHDITLAYIELLKFNKQEHELVTNDDKWIFLLKEIMGYNHIPDALQEGEFQAACEVLNKATWSDYEQNVYDTQLLDAQAQEITDKRVLEAEQDIANALEKGVEKGVEIGVEKGRKETAKNLLSMGVDISIIKQATGLTEEEISML